MKKFLVLIVASSLWCNYSCSSDDDSVSETNDPIVGSWKLVQQFENGEEIIQIECPLEITVTFASDFTGSFLVQLEDNTDCDEEPDSGPFQWKKEADNTYVVDFEDNQQTVDARFEQNRMILEYSDFDEFDGTTYEYREIYEKQ